jgi:hypothetical protein
MGPRTLLLLPWFICACVATTGGDDAGTASDGGVEETLLPPTRVEPRYLAFQIFEGNDDPAIPFDSVVHLTATTKIAAVVQDIVTAIGTTGSGRSRLAFILGPISPDHTDTEVGQLIDDGFALATALNVAVGFHLDDSMFWSRRGDLMADGSNVERVDWLGPLSTGMKLDWAHPPAKMCLNAPTIRAETTRRARQVIGQKIATHVAALQAAGRPELFAGVIAGWETHVGQDAVTSTRVGFCALSNLGFSATAPPPNFDDAIAQVVGDFINLWAAGLVQGGISPDRVYSHVAFVSRTKYERLKSQGVNVPPTYDLLVDLAPSSQRPSIAFGQNHRPGFSTYPDLGTFEQIQEELATHGNPPWASSEGTNLLPGSAVGSSGFGMETYLARAFNHGAALVNVFSWGVGGPSVKKTDPFRIVTEGDEALAAYRKFLNQP